MYLAGREKLPTFGGGRDDGAEQTVSEPVARQNHELVDGVRLEVVNAHRRRRLAARDHVDCLPVVSTVVPLVPAATPPSAGVLPKQRLPEYSSKLLSRPPR